MRTFDPKYKSDWPVGTIEIASKVFNLLDALLQDLSPDSTILSSYDIDDGDVRDLGSDILGTSSCPLAFSFTLVPSNGTRLPSFTVAVDGIRELIALGPNWLKPGVCQRWYWEYKAPDSADDQAIFTNLKEEIARWLDGRIVVYYVFNGSNMVGCQINDQNAVLWSSWRKRLWSTRDVFIVRNDPQSVEGIITDHERLLSHGH